MKHILFIISAMLLIGCGDGNNRVVKKPRPNSAEQKEPVENKPASQPESSDSATLTEAESDEEFLGMASSTGDLAKVKKLLAEGANVDSTEETGRTPIVEAAWEGHTEVVATLIANGADIDGGALRFSLKYRQPETAELLILSGANVNSEYGEFAKESPLCVAVREKLYDVSTLLVSKGANINTPGFFSQTPLDVAGRWGTIPFFLRERGAMTSDEIENGGKLDPETSSEILRSYRSYVERSPKTGSNLDIHIAVGFRDVAMLRKLIDLGSNLDAINAVGDTPLMHAAMFDNFQIAKMLIEGGADTNFSNNGRTALRNAAMHGKINIVKLFLEKGVDVNVQDHYGDTPLDHATSTIIQSDTSRQIANLLRSHGAKNGKVIDEERRQAEAKKPKLFPVFLAALDGNYDELRQKLDEGLDVNSRDAVGDTFLHNAAWKGHLEGVELLVSQKADVNALNGRKRSPLHQSVFLGQTEIAKLLISNGANVNPNDADGRTPLDWAVLLGKQDLAKLLKSHGGKETSPSLRRELTRTPEEEETTEEPDIHTAAIEGDIDSVVEILENGMDINSTDDVGSTVLHYAVSGDGSEVAKYLVSNGAEVNSLDDYQNSPLHLAAYEGNIKSAALLIKNGAHLNLLNEENETPLHLAAEEGYEEMVKLLVSKGADVNEGFHNTPLDLARTLEDDSIASFFEKNGALSAIERPAPSTPVHTALLAGNLLTLKRHILAGTSVNKRDNTGYTLLHRAAERGDQAAVDYLLESGANVELRERSSLTTALHMAAAAGNLEVVVALIEYEAQLDWIDKVRRTPLHLATKNGHLAIVDVLLDNGADADVMDKFENPPLHIAVKAGYIAIAKRLIDADADINLIGGPLKEAPLHLAVQGGQTDFAKDLLGKGADVNRKDKIGKTPLHRAAGLGNVELAKLLITNGAILNQKDNNLATPLHEAAGTGHLALAKLLIENKAGINTPGPFGDTPLDFAAKHPNVAKYLEGIGAKTGEELKAGGR